MTKKTTRKSDWGENGAVGSSQARGGRSTPYNAYFCAAAVPGGSGAPHLIHETIAARIGACDVDMIAGWQLIGLRELSKSSLAP